MMSNQQDSENSKFILRGKTAEELLSICKSTNIGVEDLANSLVLEQSIDKGYLILALNVGGDAELADTIIKAIKIAVQKLFQDFRSYVYLRNEDEFLDRRTIMEKVLLIDFISKAGLSQEEEKLLVGILERSRSKDSSNWESSNKLLEELNEFDRITASLMDENRLTLN